MTWTKIVPSRDGQRNAEAHRGAVLSALPECRHDAPTSLPNRRHHLSQVPNIVALRCLGDNFSAALTDAAKRLLPSAAPFVGVTFITYVSRTGGQLEKDVYGRVDRPRLPAEKPYYVALFEAAAVCRYRLGQT